MEFLRSLMPLSRSTGLSGCARKRATATLRQVMGCGSVALSGFLASCRSGPPLAPVGSPQGRFAYAYASPDCAPWDGRAVEILLTTRPTAEPENERPLLRLAIYPRENEVAGQTYVWPAEPEMGSGGRCAGDSCQWAPAGQIRLHAARLDSVLEGTLTLRFGPNDEVAGGFRAVWRPRRVLCG